MSGIDEVRQKTDIVAVIGRYVTLKKAGRMFRGLCPFHGEKNPSFNVYPDQQTWHCFGCNTGGDVFSFIMKRENLEFKEALHLLAEQAGVVLVARPEADREKQEKERLYQVNEAAAQYYSHQFLTTLAAEKVRDYVSRRGFNARTLLDFKIGYAPDSWESLKQHLLERGYTEKELLTAGLLSQSEAGKTYDRFRYKLMFPIQDIKGHIIGFGSRVLDDSQPKYINSPQTPVFDKSSNLYALNFAAAGIRQQDCAVIVEGYVDAIIAHQHGFTNVVASMGTSITEHQIGQLKRLSRNVILALDSDTAGKEAMQRGVSYENTLEAEVRVVTLPEGKDPDDVIKQEHALWQKLLAEAVPIVDFIITMVLSGLDLSTAKDKSAATEKLMPILAGMKDPVRQSHYLQKLARLVKVSERSLESVLGKLKSDAPRRQFPTPLSDAAQRALQPQVRNQPEEYCLAVLLQFPRLKENLGELVADYFHSSESREIFNAWQKVNDITTLKEILDPSLHNYLDRLLTRSLQSNQIELKYKDCVSRLKKEYFKSLAEKQSEVLALEAETGGTQAELAKLQEQGVQPAEELRELYSRERRKGPAA